MTQQRWWCDDKRLRRIQAASGIVFGLFIFAHLLNTALGILGQDTYDEAQRLLQIVYQHPLVEILLVALVLPLHLFAGMRRRQLRRVNNVTAVAGVIAMHRIAGWFLLFVVYGHIAAVRLPALIYDAAPGFVGVSFSIHWQPYWFYPYYFLLGFLGFYHLVVGTRLALARLLKLPIGAWSTLGLRFTNATAAVILTISLLTFGGKLTPVADPFASDYARVYLELVERMF